MIGKVGHQIAKVASAHKNGLVNSMGPVMYNPKYQKWLKNKFKN